MGAYTITIGILCTTLGLTPDQVPKKLTLYFPLRSKWEDKNEFMKKCIPITWTNETLFTTNFRAPLKKHV